MQLFTDDTEDNSHTTNLDQPCASLRAAIARLSYDPSRRPHQLQNFCRVGSFGGLQDHRRTGVSPGRVIQPRNGRRNAGVSSGGGSLRQAVLIHPDSGSFVKADFSGRTARVSRVLREARTIRVPPDRAAGRHARSPGLSRVPRIDRATAQVQCSDFSKRGGSTVLAQAQGPASASRPAPTAGSRSARGPKSVLAGRCWRDSSRHVSPDPKQEKGTTWRSYPPDFVKQRTDR